MKNTKLIPRHQIGNKILKVITDFGNAQIAGDSGIGTSMAISSGYQYNPKTRKWEQSEKNIKEAEGLRNNLAVLSTFSPTHPSNVVVEGIFNGASKLAPVMANMVKRIPYKNISINGKALSKTQIQALEQSKSQLISRGVKNPTYAQIVNNSDLGFTVPENFYSGINATQPEIQSFTGNIWMSDNKDVYTYFSNRNYPGSNNITNRFQAGYPSSAKVKEINFNGQGFRGLLDSDETVRNAIENGFDVVKQNNIVELTTPGTNIVIPEGTDRLVISQKPKFKYFDLDWMKFNYF